MPKRTKDEGGDGSAGDDALAEYRAKRDPARTTEPFSAERPLRADPAGTRRGRFVVHLHHASRRHFDLRLEVAGALRSFALPKGPTLDPALKHLAIETEAHPLDYLQFEGVIPAGNYGAGPMIVWDLGTVSYLEAPAEQGLESGKLDFWLEGYKLRGRFALVKTKEPEKGWLLLKKTDSYASSDDLTTTRPESVLSGMRVEDLLRRAEIDVELREAARLAGAPPGTVETRELEPMPCATEGAGLEEADRFYELKLDGARIVAQRRSDGGVTLRHRHGRVATSQHPDVARALELLPGGDLVLDGELVAFDGQGRPNFQKLGPRLHATKTREIARAVQQVPVVYLVFDLLELGGFDLRQLPLRTRKELLTKVVRGKGLIRALDHLEGDGRRLFELCRAQRLEGVVAKLANSPYRAGPKRTRDWVKLKCGREDDFLVVGYLTGEGARKSLGALELASYGPDGLAYRGKVGSGFDEATLNMLLRELPPKARATPAYLGRPPKEPSAERVFVEPEMVVNVRYLGWSDEGKLRFPVFGGLRVDVEPKNCFAAPGGEESGAALPNPSPNVSGALPRVGSVSGAGSAPVAAYPIKNREKVFWPQDGTTKGQLADYYAAVAPVLLPFIAGRPTLVVRHPDGVEGKSFFQWNPPTGFPGSLRSIQLRGPEAGQGAFYIDDLAALMYVVDLGAIPLHVLSTRDPLGLTAEFLTLDFDVPEGQFTSGVILALALKELLAEIGLTGFPKTSGQTGLHVLVPLGDGVPADAARIIGELMGRALVMAHPSLGTLERRIDSRGGKVLIDTGQTGRGRAIAAPYSVRASNLPLVSTPLSWDEVHLALDPRRFTIHTVPERLEQLGDAYGSFFDGKPDVSRAVVLLERALRR